MKVYVLQVLWTVMIQLILMVELRYSKLATYIATLQYIANICSYSSYNCLQVAGFMYIVTANQIQELKVCRDV